MTADDVTSRSMLADTEATRLLRRCGRHVLSNGDFDAPSSLLDGKSLDWQSTLELARRHRMDLLLFRTLKALPREAYPTDVHTALERRLRATQTRNLSMVAELVSIVDTLESNGVRVLTYKGPVVARRAYGDISLRRFVDLDLLVAPEDSRSAIDVLAGRGYEPRRVKEQLFETVLTRPSDSLHIDLHTQIVPRYFPFRLSFEELYDRRTMVDVGGRSVPALSTSDAVVAHSIHGSKHHWFRMEWILATAALLRQVTAPVDLFVRARRVGCERMVLLGAELSRRLFDATFSPAIERRLDESSRSMRAVRTAADETVAWLFHAEWVDKKHDPRTHLADFRLRSRLHSGIEMKLRFWVNALTNPRKEDREFIDLPTQLSPLYRLVRPARLLYEYRKLLFDRVDR